MGGWMNFTNYTLPLVYLPISYSGNAEPRKERRILRERWIHRNLSWTPIFQAVPWDKVQRHQSSTLWSMQLSNPAYSTLGLDVKAKWGFHWPPCLTLQPILSSTIPTLGLLPHLYPFSSSPSHSLACTVLHNLFLCCVCPRKQGFLSIWFSHKSPVSSL